MNRGRFSVRLLLILFPFNSILLTLYLLRSQPLTENPQSQSLAENRQPQSPSRNKALKPWQILPSFLPQSHDPSAAAHSCEGYFGNGFSQRTDLVHPSDGTIRRRRSTTGWFHYFYCKTLESSMYEGSPVGMNSDRIRMSIESEKLEALISRAAEEELLSFESGTLEMMGNQDDRSGKIVSMDLRKWNWKKMCRKVQVNGVLHGSSPLLPTIGMEITKCWNRNYHSCLIPFETHSTLHSIPA